MIVIKKSNKLHIPNSCEEILTYSMVAAILFGELPSNLFKEMFAPSR